MVEFRGELMINLFITHIGDRRGLLELLFLSCDADDSPPPYPLVVETVV